MGKRQIGSLQPSELAITILISNIASMPIENLDMPLILGAAPILILLCLEVAISSIGLKHRKFRRIVSGKPIFVIENGKVNQKALKALRFSVDDLFASLRSCGVFNIRDIDYAVVETNGTMSVFKKFMAQNITPAILNIKERQSPIPLVILSDGKPVKSNLNYLDIDENWLIAYLKKNNLKMQDIFLITADKNKNMFIAKKENS